MSDTTNQVAFDLAKAKFSSVTFGGKEYAMTDAAQMDNYGTDGAVRYYARAIDVDGGEYTVEWETCAEWDASGAIAQLEMRGALTDEAKAEIIEQYGLDGDFEAWDLSDESDSCDWDSPVGVKQV